MTTIEHLPAHILVHIFREYLSPVSIAVCSLVDKHFAAVIKPLRGHRPSIGDNFARRRLIPIGSFTDDDIMVEQSRLARWIITTYGSRQPDQRRRMSSRKLFARFVDDDDCEMVEFYLNNCTLAGYSSDQSYDIQIRSLKMYELLNGGCGRGSIF